MRDLVAPNIEAPSTKSRSGLCVKIRLSIGSVEPGRRTPSHMRGFLLWTGFKFSLGFRPFCCSMC